MTDYYQNSDNSLKENDDTNPRPLDCQSSALAN